MCLKLQTIQLEGEMYKVSIQCDYYLYFCRETARLSPNPWFALGR